MTDGTGSLDIQITGKAVLLFETTVGPIEFKINELDTVKDILRIIVSSGTRTTVDAYSDEEKVVMETLLSSVGTLSPESAPAHDTND